MAHADHPPKDATRRPAGTVTLLFTDIEGSTRLLHALGDRYQAVLAAHHDLLRAAWTAYAGVEVDTQGDAFFVAFVRATDAVAATVAAQRALAAHPWPGEGTVRVRMGLHTGEPQISAEGYVGIDVHRAARICAAAHGGQVLLSQVTADLVRSSLPADVDLRQLGTYRLKDLVERERLSQLTIVDLPADFPPLRTADAPGRSGGLFGRGRDRAQETAAPDYLALGRLIERDGDVVVSAHLLRPGVTRIGRDTDNDVVVASSHISRYHAEIRWDGRQYVLHDLGSKNGTVLNGRRLTRAWPLADGDVLTFADLTDPSFVFGASERTVTVGRTNMG